jgi:hypothetical protein
VVVTERDRFRTGGVEVATEQLSQGVGRVERLDLAGMVQRVADVAKPDLLAAGCV